MTATLLRIKLLLDHPSPHMSALLAALSERDDVAVSVLYCGESGPGRSWGSPRGSLPNRIEPGVSLAGGFRLNPGLLSACAEARVDVWVLGTCYTSPSTYIATRALNHAGRPWVYMNEAPRLDRLASVKTLFLAHLLAQAKGVVGTGVSAAETYRRLCPALDRVRSIPYYVDLAELWALPLPTAPPEDAPVELLSVGQLIPRKGIDVLLKACAQLPIGTWRLNLYGAGSAERELEGLAALLGLQDRVIFHGAVPFEQRAEAFRGKHVFVFPSRWDGWGMVLPEAMGAGLPCVATSAVGSARDFIVDGEGGYVVASDSPEALATKLKTFVLNHEHISSMGAAARKATSGYRAESGATDLVDLCREVASVHSSQGTADRSLSLRYYYGARSALRGAWIRAATPRPFVAPQRSFVLAYHTVRDSNVDQFRRQLSFLRDHFSLLSLSEILSRADEHALPAVALTFDDGFRCLRGACLEVLEEYGIQATFFIPTAFVEAGEHGTAGTDFWRLFPGAKEYQEPMTRDDLTSLVDRGHEIGSHGHSHVSLAECTPQLCSVELRRSRSLLQAWTGQPVTSFAFPYGESATSEVLESFEHAGYSAALTLRRGGFVSLPPNSPERYRIPREHVEGDTTLQELQYFLGRTVREKL